MITVILHLYKKLKKKLTNYTKDAERIKNVGKAKSIRKKYKVHS